MITIKKMLVSDLPYGLSVSFDQAIKAAYDGNDFYIVQNSIRYNLTMMAVNDSTFNLIFKNEDIVNIDFSIQMTLIYAVLDTSFNPISGSEDFIYDDLSDINDSENPGDPEPPVGNPAEFKVIIEESKIRVIVDPSTIAHKDLYYITVKAFDFYLYLDFAKDTIIVTEHTNESLLEISFPFIFEKDTIYHIETTYVGGTDDTNGDPIDSTTTLEKYIKPIPSLYFTSRYHLYSLMEELEIQISIVEDFELQILIWKYSQLSYEISGLHVSDRSTLKEYEQTVLGNYVGYKIILTKYVAYILSSSIIQIDDDGNTIVPNPGLDLKLADYQVDTSSGGSSIVGTKIAALKEIIEDLEQIIKGLSNARAFKSYEPEASLVNRPSVAHPKLQTKVSGKRSEKLDWSVGRRPRGG